MTERRLTFIDCDENPLVVWLKDDRVQLAVIDSRPELEAGELARFASALFAAYAAAPLAARLASVCTKLGGMRDQLAATAGAGELLAALDESVATVEDVTRVMTAATAIASDPDPDPEPAQPPESPELPDPPDPPDSPDPPEPPMGSVLTAYDRFRKPKRAKRAGEGDGFLDWGWVRHRGPIFAGVAC